MANLIAEHWEALTFAAFCMFASVGVLWSMARANKRDLARLDDEESRERFRQLD